jgi:hypothetical protein
MISTKSMIIGILLGACIGLWFGVNIGKEQAIFSNPLTDKSLTDRVKKTGEKIIEKSADMIEKGGQKLEQSGQAIKKKMQEEELK